MKYCHPSDHPFTLSPCHLVTLPPCHLVTLSPCHLVTLSPCHPLLPLLASVIYAAVFGTVRRLPRQPPRPALARPADCRRPESQAAPDESVRRPRGALERLRHAPRDPVRRAALRAPAAVRHADVAGEDDRRVQDVAVHEPQARRPVGVHGLHLQDPP